MNLQLKEQKNTVQIIGELKSIKLNWGRKDKNGREYVSGNLVIKTTNKHGVGEHRLNIMQYRMSKSGNEIAFFKALKTIETKYRNIEEHGEGTLLKAMASIESNVYYNANKDEMVETTSLKPYKITSNDEELANAEQGVLASVGGFLDNIFKDENGKVTCRIATVNFFGNLIPIKCEVKPELADKFLELFENESTVRSLKIEIVKAAKVSEAAISTNDSDEFDGFGDCEEITDEVITDYVNANIIIGGQPKFDPEINLDPEAVKEAYKQRELEIAQRLEEERSKKVEDDFSSDEGFGMDSDDMDDELPF